MSEQTADNADSTTASDDNAAPSTAEGIDELEELEGEQSEEETQDEPEAEEDSPEVILTRNTQKRFDENAAEIRELKERVAKNEERGPLEFTDLVEPKEEDFDSDIEYAAAKGAYEGTKNTLTLLNKNQERESQQQHQAAANQKTLAYNQQVVEIEKSVPDFKQVVNASLLQTKDANGNLTASAEFIIEEARPDVALSIGRNPELAQTLNRCTPVQAHKLLIQLADDLSASPAPLNVAPEPITSEDTGAGPAAQGGNEPFLGRATFK